jgi:chemotaxis protein CheZ
MSSPTIRLEDAQNCLDTVIVTLRGQDRPDKNLLATVLEHIASYIQVTKHEIASLRANDGQKDVFATASDELEEVIGEAARATNEILSAAESIERQKADAAERDRAVGDAVTRIYTACAFQDITGQRIAKVIRTLKEIETRVAVLAMACSGEVQERATEATASSGEAGLLNGPQLTAHARSQDEIDALFSSTD